MDAVLTRIGWLGLRVHAGAPTPKMHTALLLLEIAVTLDSPLIEEVGA